MNDRAVFLALGVTAGAAAWWMIRQQQQGAEVGEFLTDSFEELSMSIQTAIGAWRPPAKYAGLIAAAEDRHGLPRDLLARLLWQESRYREDIITGRVRSPVGAIGIAQFMPATAAEWGVDPLNVDSAIDGAARYLRWLHNRLGAWDRALAAYNWGIGNVQRKGLAAASRETRNYYTSILSDVGLA